MHCDDKGKKRMKKAVGSVAKKAAEGADSLLSEARKDVVAARSPEPKVDKATSEMAEAVSKVTKDVEQEASKAGEDNMKETVSLINSLEFTGGNKKMDKQFIMESLQEAPDENVMKSKEAIGEFIIDLHETQMDEEGKPLLGENDLMKVFGFIDPETFGPEEAAADPMREGKAKGGEMDDGLLEDVQRYLTLYEGFEESMDKAKTPEDEKRIYKRFKQHQDTFEPSTVSAALKSLDESNEREGKMLGGILVSLSESNKDFFSKVGDDSILQKIKSGGTQQESSISNLEGADPIEPSNNLPSLGYAEGGDVDEDDMPVDTYDNIPEDEIEEVKESQLPDDEMEEEYASHVLTESLNSSDKEYLMSALGEDEKLNSIFNKVMDTAGEFAGEGAVEGPGTGTSDSIPARLSDGEFVFTKKAVDAIGADKLQEMMDDAERDYDEDREGKYEGGMMDSLLDGKDYDEEVHNQMLSANAMPSVRKR